MQKQFNIRLNSAHLDEIDAAVDSLNRIERDSTTLHRLAPSVSRTSFVVNAALAEARQIAAARSATP